MGIEKGEAAPFVAGAGQFYVLPRYLLPNRPWLKTSLPFTAIADVLCWVDPVQPPWL